MRALLATALLVGSCAKHDNGTTPVTLANPVSRIELVPNGPAKTSGTLEARNLGDKDVELTGTIVGLAPGEYVLHRHAPRGCTPPAKGHEDEFHTANLGATITADASGTVEIKITIRNERIGGQDPMSGCVIIYPLDASMYIATGAIAHAAR